MSIQEHLNKIRNAIYGREVRESIAKGIETAYDDASENGNANMEVKVARGTNPNLNTRLNKMEDTDRQTAEKVDSNHQEVTTQLAQKAEQSDIRNLSTRVEDVIQSADLDPNKDIEVVDGRNGEKTLGTAIKKLMDQTEVKGIANIINNGDFSGGSSSWDSIGSSVDVESNEATVLSNSETGNGRIRQIADVPSGHTIYYSAFVKSTSTQVGVANHTTLVKSHSGSGEFERLSGTISSPSTSGISIIDKRTSEWDEFKVKDVMVIDLTAFGDNSTELEELLIQNVPNFWFDGRISLVKTDDLYKKTQEIETGMNRTIGFQGDLLDGTIYDYTVVTGVNHTFQPYSGAKSYVYSLEPNKKYYIQKAKSSRFRVATLDQPFQIGNTYQHKLLYENNNDNSKSQRFSFTSGLDDVTLVVQVALDEDVPSLYVSDKGFVELNATIHASNVIDLHTPNSEYYLPTLGVNKYVRPMLTSVETTLKDTVHTDIYDGYDLISSDFPSFTKTELGQDSLGNKINMYSSLAPRVPKGKPIPKITITSGIHGNEKIAVWTMLKFFENLYYNPDNRDEINYLRDRVDFLIIPVVNPSGYDANRRHNENMVNLNRNFETGWEYVPVGDWAYSGEQPLSEIEAQIVNDFILDNLDSDLHIDKHNTWNANSIYMGDGSEQIEQISVDAVKSFYFDWVNEFGAVNGDDHVAIYSPTYPGALFNHTSALGIPSVLTEESFGLPFAPSEYSDVSLKCGFDLIANFILQAVKTF